MGALETAIALTASEKSADDTQKERRDVKRAKHEKDNNTVQATAV